MAVKKWALLNDKVVNIDSLSKTERKSYTGVVKCCGCGRDLICRMGEKNDWHFAHQSDSTCAGGSPETILHKLVKEIIASSDRIILPKGIMPVWKDVLLDVFEGGTYLYDKNKVYVEKKFGDVIPDVTIDMGDFWLFIEVWVRHKVSESKRKKYSSISEPFVVVELDMREYSKNLDDIAYDDLRSFVLSGVYEKEIIQSTDMLYYEKVYKDSLYNIPSGRLLCPATDFKSVIDSKHCHKCMYYIGKGVCTGRSCLVKKSDYTLRDQTKQDRLDLHYSELSPVPPNPLGEAVMYSPRWFGDCSCGGELELCTGECKTDVTVLGIPAIKDKRDAYAYTRCKKCGKLTQLRCPNNKDHIMNICVNKTGLRRNIFLACENYQSKDNGFDSCACNTSLTIYRGTTVGDNYADELIAVGGLPKFLKKDKRGMDRLNALVASKRG